MDENLKLKEMELKVLDKFVDICKNNDLKYYLAYGTLLGAVRHKGFIPWDDDVDIFMPYDDLKKFKKICKNNLDSEFYYQDKLMDKFYYNFWPKFGLENTTWMPRNRLVNCKYGICIDLFPIFEFKAEEKNKNKMNKYYKILNLGASKYFVVNNKDIHYAKYKVFIQKYIPNFINNFLYNASLKKLSKFSKNYDTIAIPDIDINGVRYFKKDDFIGEKTLIFENRELRVPNNPDILLKEFYGNYMELPPENERYGHDIDSNSIIYDFKKSYKEYF